MNIVPLASAIAGPAGTGLFIFLGVVALVLLIACTNVANLMLARSVSRLKELAIRSALGAGGRRILQQLLVESTILSLAGGLLGLLLSGWIVRALVSVMSQFNVPRLAEAHPDARVLVFTLAISLLAGTFFGAVFAFSVDSPKLSETLRESGRPAAEHARGGHSRRVLIVVETAMALILLASAGVLLKSILVMRTAAPGFHSQGVLTVEFWLPQKKFAATLQRIQFFNSVLARAKSVNGIRSVALVADLPLGGGSDSLGFHIAGKPAPGAAFDSLFNVASSGYFRTMGVPVLAGREFTESDSANTAPVAVINRAAAVRFWPGEDPVGKQISLSETDRFTVIGVVGDTRQMSLGMAPRPEFFLNYMQPSFSWPWLVMVARTDGDPARLTGTLKSAVQQVDSDVPVTNILPMDDVLAASMAQPELFAGLLSVFAALALVLAAVGLYGVVSYLVAQRTHEMGIRIALGASRREIFYLVLKQALVLTLCGASLGILCSLGATQLLVHLVPAARPGDPLTLAGVSILFLCVAFAASYLPAWCATKVDPMVALRYE